MTFRVFRLLFVALFALSLTALSGSVWSQTILDVPKAECPGAPVAEYSCWIVLSSPQTCVRKDSGVEEISSGTEYRVENGYFIFENCDGCPESTPSTQSFSQKLSVPFTEKVMVTVADYGFFNITEADDVKAKLEKSIGHYGARTAPASVSDVTCSAAVSGCELHDGIAFLKVRKGIKTRMTHEYEWFFNVTHDPMPMEPHWSLQCSICQLKPSNPYPGNIFPKQASSTPEPRYSTADGSAYGAAANCEAWLVRSCDWSW